MKLTLTPELVAGFADKDSKVPEYRELYEKHDFLEAYALHTDARVRKDPKWAIGRGDEWETHGHLQLDFLKRMGMKPAHRLIDIGCGVGRGARRFVPYLDAGNYIGIDISTECLRHARELADIEGWAAREPHFFESLLDLAPASIYHYVWAHSVFTHLPPDFIEPMIGLVAELLHPDGMFCFTYKKADAPHRSGLKQFQYPAEYFRDVAGRFHLNCEKLHDVWPAHQLTIKLTHAQYSTL